MLIKISNISPILLQKDLSNRDKIINIMFNLSKRNSVTDNNLKNISKAVNSAIGISNVAVPIGNETKLPDNNPINSSNNNIKSNDNCSHLFIRYPPLIGKIKTCLKCGILLAPGGIQGGDNTVRLSGNHIENRLLLN